MLPHGEKRGDSLPGKIMLQPSMAIAICVHYSLTYKNGYTIITSSKSLNQNQTSGLFFICIRFIKHFFREG